MRLLFALFLLSVAAFLFSAQLDSAVDAPQSVSDDEPIRVPMQDRAVSILANNCASCHALDGREEAKIAPTFRTIKAAYAKQSASEADFVQSMTRFLQQPEADQAKLPEAVKSYGIMPNLGLSESDYQAVASYLYTAELQKSDWYTTTFVEDLKQWEASQQEAEVDYLSKGKDLSSATKVVIGKNLIGAINSRGTEGAVDFCNERAIPLTDSMATVLKASIKRVSDRARNPMNAANASERAYIKSAKAELFTKGEITPKSFDQGDKVIAYYPIITNQMCMQCHGSPQQDIEVEVLRMIQEKYPQDKATGYEPNQVRGIWVIEMDKD